MANFIDNLSWQDPIKPGLDFSGEPPMTIGITTAIDEEELYEPVWRGTCGPDGEFDYMKILSQYLEAPRIFSGFTPATQTFQYQPLFWSVWDDEQDIRAGIRTIAYDWSYEFNTNNLRCLNQPISNRLVSGQYCFLSARNYTGNDYYTTGYQWTIPDGATTIQKVTVTSQDDPSTEFYQYKIDDSCADYVIYYVNRIGGIDSFAFTKVATPKYTKTTNFITNNYIASDQVFDKHRYMSKINRTITLNSGALTDEQAYRFDEIFTSPMTWIHHIGKAEFINTLPYATCSIDMNSIQLVSYRSLSKQVPTYQFTVRLNDIIIR